MAEILIAVHPSCNLFFWTSICCVSVTVSLCQELELQDSWWNFVKAYQRKYERRKDTKCQSEYITVWQFTCFFFFTCVLAYGAQLYFPSLQIIKKHLKNGKNLSTGFGFVELDSIETATNVCRDLQVRTYGCFIIVNHLLLVLQNKQLPMICSSNFQLCYFFAGNCAGWACFGIATLPC